MKATETIRHYLLTAIVVALAALPGAAGVRVVEDVSGDGVVDIDDVNAVINVILHKNQDPSTERQADIDGSGVVDVDDLNAVLNALLTHQWHEERTGYDYVWHYDALPEVHLDIPLDEWNRLLTLYDADRLTKEYVHADVRFVTDEDETVVADAGLRLRGNGSRRRPEGSAGETHTAGNTVWHPTGFGLNLRKYHKDSAHTLRGVRKVHLRYFYHDPTYVRELFCYRLLEQYGVWTAPRDTYCRLWVHVQGDIREAYYGVYTLLEPVDERYLKDRGDRFGGTDGYLWKCGQGVASLTGIDAATFGTGTDEAAYVLKTRTGELAAARAQLRAFSDSLTVLADSAFARWLPTVCDVPLLVHTYATIVATGSWDDYWNNSNNYYLYFNSTDPEQYCVFLIPYDLDNTLGSSRKVHAITDSGRHDPMRWGCDERNPLIARMLRIDEYRQMYVQCLSELVDEHRGLMDFHAAVSRIQGWHALIAPHVPSDVDRDNVLADQPSKLGNQPRYRLLDDDPQWNFFQVRTAVIDSVAQCTNKGS